MTNKDKIIKGEHHGAQQEGQSVCGGLVTTGLRDSGAATMMDRESNFLHGEEMQSGVKLTSVIIYLSSDTWPGLPLVAELRHRLSPLWLTGSSRTQKLYTSA
ncbi:hypothetical protein Baya_13703 [Bagarius yarrelli]|uniref:Uncharacterized protein n=1 Tax=Bagarius yarrelli TaxID=175774 RepID=A0A556V6Q5_BAGYA|nr:hypothetical protein Baya_13703 [Bagarius yarrelli]